MESSRPLDALARTCPPHSPVAHSRPTPMYTHALHDEPQDSILKPVSPLAAVVDAASLEDLALFAIAVNRRTREEATPSSASLPHPSSRPTR